MRAEGPRPSEASLAPPLASTLETESPCFPCPRMSLLHTGQVTKGRLVCLEATQRCISLFLFLSKTPLGIRCLNLKHRIISHKNPHFQFLLEMGTTRVEQPLGRGHGVPFQPAGTPSPPVDTLLFCYLPESGGAPEFEGVASQTWFPETKSDDVTFLF